MYRQSFTNLLTYCQLLWQNIRDPMNVYPKMINLERYQKYLKTYTSFFFEASQEFLAFIIHEIVLSYNLIPA